MYHRKKLSFLALIATLIVACIVATLVYHFVLSGNMEDTKKNTAATIQSPSEESVDLTSNQLSAVTVEVVGTHRFHIEKEAMGSIAYHDAMHAGANSKSVVANVVENDSPLIHVGQPVTARVGVYPDRVFTGKVSAVGVTVYDSGGNPAIDPVTHRIAVRCDIDDPGNALYPGMLATIRIQVNDPVDSVAIPENGVVREGDGTMTAWVTNDRQHFSKRVVKIGVIQDGYDQVLDGVSAGESVVTDNAVFLSNMNNADSQ